MSTQDTSYSRSRTATPTPTTNPVAGAVTREPTLVLDPQNGDGQKTVANLEVKPIPPVDARVKQKSTVILGAPPPQGGILEKSEVDAYLRRKLNSKPHPAIAGGGAFSEVQPIKKNKTETPKSPAEKEDGRKRKKEELEFEDATGTQKKNKSST